jgi:hypothetical protein
MKNDGTERLEKRYLFLVKPLEEGGRLDVKLDEQEYQGYKWVKLKEELDGLRIATEVRVVIDHVLEALAKGPSTPASQ